MTRFSEGWGVQKRVVGALMIRELTTRFGRENIGFLWMMAEPLLFAGLVAIMWRFMRGQSEHGVDIVAFVVSGYLPLTLFRHAMTRCIGVFFINSSLLYHRQVKLLDFIFVRFAIEMLGSMMAYLFIGTILYYFGLFPMPAAPGYLLIGWFIYCLFVFSVCLIIAPLSEMSEVLEKFMPVTTYIMVPFSGTFNMMSWLSPKVRDVLAWSPPVSAMEMMRYGLWGDSVTVYYSFSVPLGFAIITILIGLTLCRRIRRKLVVE